MKLISLMTYWCWRMRTASLDRLELLAGREAITSPTRRYGQPALRRLRILLPRADNRKTCHQTPKVRLYPLVQPDGRGNGSLLAGVRFFLCLSDSCCAQGRHRPTSRDKLASILSHKLRPVTSAERVTPLRVRLPLWAPARLPCRTMRVYPVSATMEAATSRCSGVLPHGWSLTGRVGGGSSDVAIRSFVVCDSLGHDLGPGAAGGRVDALRRSRGRVSFCPAARRNNKPIGWTGTLTIDVRPTACPFSVQ